MMMRFPRTALAGLAFSATLATFGSSACNTDTAVATADSGGGGETDSAGGGGDGSSSDGGGGSDVASDVTKSDGGSEGGSCSQGTAKPSTGETCVGFGKKDPCNTACGEYGFVCFNGGPPGFTGCLQLSASAFGETYCCTTNKCVAQPDQDAMCTSVAGKPHRYQCPPNGAGGNVSPPSGCEEKGSGTSEVEKFYCCP